MFRQLLSSNLKLQIDVPLVLICNALITSNHVRPPKFRNLQFKTNFTKQ